MFFHNYLFPMKKESTNVVASLKDAVLKVAAAAGDNARVAMERLFTLFALLEGDHRLREQCACFY